MKRSAITPFIVIMAVGVLAMLLISFKGIGDSKELAAELEGGGKEQEQVAANPEEIYQQNCIGCHGQQYEGTGKFPALKGVGDRRSKDEIKDIIVNGKTGNIGTMPAGLVKPEQADKMADWLSSLK